MSRLLVFGDLHCERRHLRGLVERAVQEQCDALVSLGDLCYLPRDPEGRRFLRSAGALLRRAGLELLLVDGNHDDAEALARARGQHLDDDGEWMIQHLLREAGSEGINEELASVTADGLEAQADWTNLGSPETYLGYQQGLSLDSPDGVAYDEPRGYVAPESLQLNT